MSDQTHEKSDFDTLLRAFAVFDDFDISASGLGWRTDGEYAPLTLFVNCNDLFFWGCSDCEDLGPSNISELEQAAKDAEAAGDKGHGDLLFCARRRKMRPQAAYYKYFKDGLKPLFDACGPARDLGLGNPG